MFFMVKITHVQAFWSDRWSFEYGKGSPMGDLFVVSRELLSIVDLEGEEGEDRRRFSEACHFLTKNNLPPRPQPHSLRRSNLLSTAHALHPRSRPTPKWAPSSSSSWSSASPFVSLRSLRKPLRFALPRSHEFCELRFADTA